ncbi:putative retroelement [Abeliophyllum distichum]|uniref:Retroelement n=1 Tax=Abeliophyllum distichum TaxID=126358 RepID=A0ABD1V448_9LAMI
MKNSSKGTDLKLDMQAVDINPNQAEVEVYLAELIKGATYACPIMAKSEMSIKNEPAKEENKKARTFSFDITKAEVIFDRLYKDKQTRLSEKHKLPISEQIKGKIYCKWHNTWSHTTNSCLVFRHVLQDAIESGKITFESKKKMAMDKNPFPQPIDVNMVIPNLDKFGFPIFKLVVDNGKDERHASAFERLKRNEVELRRKINKVDCLEEGIFAKELEGDLERIAKSGYAQAQDLLTKINLGDERRSSNLHQPVT